MRYIFVIDLEIGKIPKLIRVICWFILVFHLKSVKKVAGDSGLGDCFRPLHHFPPPLSTS